MAKKKGKRNKKKVTSHKLRSPSDLLDILPRKYYNKGCFKYAQGFLWLTNTCEGAVALTAFLKSRGTYGCQCFSRDIEVLIRSENAMTTAINILRFHTTTRTRGMSSRLQTLLDGATPIPTFLLSQINAEAVQFSGNKNGCLFPNEFCPIFKPEYFPLFLATVWNFTCGGRNKTQCLLICNELALQLENFSEIDFENCSIKNVMELATGPPPTFSDIQYFLGVIGVRICKQLNRSPNVTQTESQHNIQRLLYYSNLQIEARPTEAEGYVDLGVGKMRSDDLIGAVGLNLFLEP